MPSYPSLSFWEKDTFLSNIDVAIIGSGIVGLNAAISLKEQEPGLRVAVFERGVLPMGASTRNAGFACFGSLTELLDDLSKMTESEVLHLVELRWKGLQRLRQRIGDDQMDFQLSGNYEIFRPSDHQAFAACMEKLPFFNKSLESITGVKDTYTLADQELNSFGFAGASHLIKNTMEGQLDTGKMMRALLHLAHMHHVHIFNSVNILKLVDQDDRVCLHTESFGQIFAKKAIVATNGFAQKLIPRIPVQPARNQVLITKPIPKLKVKGCFHYDQGYVYFRNVGNRILLGGARNHFKIQEQTSELENTPEIQHTLRKILRDLVLPDTHFEIDQWWSGILGVGPQKKPIVSNLTANTIVAVRLGGMGVAIGSLIGEEAAKLVLN